MAALSQMPLACGRAENIFENTTQPSQFCRPFFQVRPSATDTKRLEFNNEVKFGTQVSVVIPHDGDFLTGATLEVKMTKLPNQYPTSVASYYPVEALCKRVSLSVGGTVLDTHTSNWFRLYDEYVRSDKESRNYRRMANFDPETLTTAVPCTETLYLPMVFSFFRDVRCSLPIGPLNNSEVRLTITLATAAEVGVQATPLQAALYVDYAMVDAVSRQVFMSRPIHIMFEQVQYNGGQYIDPASPDHFVTVRSRLGFKQPTKALFWLINETESNDPFRSMHARWVGDAASTYLALQPSANDFGGYNLIESISEKLAPVRRACLKFNGVDRVPYTSARYFNAVAPLQHCKRSPFPGSYIYPFADDITSLQPTQGICNLSNFNDIQLLLQLKKTTTSSITDVDAFAGCNAEDVAKNIDTLRGLDIFAWSYNMCTIEGGLLTVALST